MLLEMMTWNGFTFWFLLAWLQLAWYVSGLDHNGKEGKKHYRLFGDFDDS